MGELRYLSGPDLLDILVISFLAHRIWVLFRGTAALQVMVGLIFLWVIHGVAEAAGLVLTSRFLESLGTVGLVAIVVLFRNEIREVLVQNVPARLLLGQPSGSGRSKRLPAVVEAAFEMAATRTGALLVFQDRDRLATHVHNGIALEGLISVQVLRSIFSKESPVHDGAVVIRGNRIERVGAILPLTRQAELPLEFGTRHRAALGISEVSDAVVVVVSEERGEVSVVRRGIVERIDEPSALEATLRRHLRREPNRARFAGLARELIRQAAVFLLILGAVAVYWGVYLGRQVSLISVTTPIDFRNIPSALEMRAPSIDHVEVQIRGKRPLVEGLKPEQVTVFVDLKGARAGPRQSSRLGAGNVELPVGLEVVQVTPPSVAVDLERRLTAAVRVRARLVGALPRGLRLGEVTVEPATVRVRGPESDLRGLAAIPTTPIDLRGLRADQTPRAFDTDLVLYPASIKLDAGQPRRVRVTVRLIPAPGPPKPAGDGVE